MNPRVRLTERGRKMNNDTKPIYIVYYALDHTDSYMQVLVLEVPTNGLSAAVGVSARLPITLTTYGDMLYRLCSQTLVIASKPFDNVARHFGDPTSARMLLVDKTKIFRS